MPYTVLARRDRVSVLFNEPKLLKGRVSLLPSATRTSFSALQRAEIAEIYGGYRLAEAHRRFSALQRAEIAENVEYRSRFPTTSGFQCSSTSRNC